MKKETFLWHDYETFGISPVFDRPSQFAAVRTDSDFNIIGEPIVIYCKAPKDVMPSPEACLVTGITPQLANQKGVNEVSFFNKIYEEMTKAKTCSVGYNSVNFDDEFTRYGFFRNLIDPYEREWKNNCSRWDIINIARIMHALDDNCLNVDIIDGKKDFRLESLSKLNDIVHENAHDALSDVYATIGIAKKLKDFNKEIFQELFNKRLKNNVKSTIELGKPILISDSFFGSENNYIEIFVPLVYQKNGNPNELLGFKISRENIEYLKNSSIEEIKGLLFKKKNDFVEGEKDLQYTV